MPRVSVPTTMSQDLPPLVWETTARRQVSSARHRAQTRLRSRSWVGTMGSQALPWQQGCSLAQRLTARHRQSVLSLCSAIQTKHLSRMECNCNGRKMGRTGTISKKNLLCPMHLWYYRIKYGRDISALFISMGQ